MKLLSIIKNIWQHPLNKFDRLSAVLRFFKWQVLSRLLRHPIIYPFIDKSVLIVERGMTGATGNIYNGLHEYEDMLFVLHFLREDDLFVDVGANVGVYTVLAAQNCKSKVISFEPIKVTFEHLQRNVLINNISDRVLLINKAAANETKTVYFTTSLDAGNHVILDETIDNQQLSKIECTSLDLTLQQIPVLVKIDVEGFETEVIQGAQKTFKNHLVKAIIIELNGSGARYGFDESSIHATLLQYGFVPYSYNPFFRTLEPLEHWGTHNSIYIRDLNFVRDRIATAPKVYVNNLLL